MENLKEIINNPYFVNYIAKPLISDILVKFLPNDNTAFDAYRDFRRERFLSELEKNANNIKINTNIDKNEIIRRTFETAQLIPKTREEKLKYLARLLQYSISEDEYILADEFDDYLKILDELSVREIQILCIFYDYNEKFIRNEKENDAQYSHKFWNDFISEINGKFSLNNDESSAILQRTSRTGCIEPITGTYYGYKGGEYKITPLFRELAKIAKIRTADFSYEPAS